MTYYQTIYIKHVKIYVNLTLKVESCNAQKAVTNTVKYCGSIHDLHYNAARHLSSFRSLTVSTELKRAVVVVCVSCVTINTMLSK